MKFGNSSVQSLPVGLLPCRGVRVGGGGGGWRRRGARGAVAVPGSRLVPIVAAAARGSRLGLQDLGDLSPPSIEEVRGGGATVDGGAAGLEGKRRKEKGADSARRPWEGVMRSPYHMIG
jgi:hypothetical protein